MTIDSNGTDQAPEFLLHTYYRSSCSGRLRIALNLKAIPAKYAYVHLYDNEQMSKEHEALNPSRSSAAAIEYLDEVLPDKTTLPPPLSQPLDRAKVRALTNIITNDIQPITNRRIAKAVDSLGGDVEMRYMNFMPRGLQAYERIATKTAGKYSVGDAVSMADVCLVPAIWNVENSAIDLEGVPTVTRIYRALSEPEAVKKAQWSVQADCPEDGFWL